MEERTQQVLQGCNTHRILELFVMCSGRIDPQFVLKAFKEGADGVFVAGCHMGDCHYDAGNYKLDRRMRLIYKLVEDMGIGAERVHHDWISASEGEKFSEAVKMMDL